MVAFINDITQTMKFSDPFCQTQIAFYTECLKSVYPLYP